ncbi:hypothetical protein OPT61_g8185 [Boeremia exigua]|uniref:Uncharacterized protein n=1 Tax=Boeremia exigua TaxID=749465 RepID=A0ACC2HZZ3_9PLEO|nr:hypothetical protein OPT61_g8185 [Boeremia exigua]
MSDTAHRLANSNSCVPSNELGWWAGAEGAVLGISASLLDPGGGAKIHPRDGYNRLQRPSPVQAPSSNRTAAAEVSRIAAYRIASICRRI